MRQVSTMASSRDDVSLSEEPGRFAAGADASALLVFPAASPSDGDLSPSERRVEALRSHLRHVSRVDGRGGFLPPGAMYVNSSALLEHVSSVDGLGGYLPHTLEGAPVQPAAGAPVTWSSGPDQVLFKERVVH